MVRAVKITRNLIVLLSSLKKEHTFEHLIVCGVLCHLSWGPQSCLGQISEWPWRMLLQRLFILESVPEQDPLDFSALFLQIITVS